MSIPQMGVTSGSPPYRGSAFKAALRQALAAGLGNIGAGLGAVPRGANFGTAFAAAAGGASKAYSAAQQAAQEYALKQQQAQEQRDLADFTKAHLAAQTKALEKPAPPVKKDITNMTDEEFAQYVKRVAAESAAKNSGKPMKAAQAGGAGGAEPTLSPGAITDYATLVHQQGVSVLSRLGFGGKSGMRQQILNRHHELYPNDNLAAIEAGYRGTSGAIQKIDQNRAAINAYGPGAIAAMNEVEAAMRQIPETGNQPLNSVARRTASTFGSPGMARFQKALPIANIEFTRVIANPNLSGMLTNEQIHTVSQGSGPNATRKQMHAAAQVLRYLYTTRKNALDAERESLVGSIGGSGSNSSQPQATHIWNPSTQTLTPVGR